MNAIEYIKKYQDTKKELDKSNENFYTVFNQLQKAQSEIEELKKMEWAVRKIQQNYRGRRGRLYFKDMMKKKKMDAIRQQYILEREAQAARERWEADRYEMMYREKVQREVDRNNINL